jgi:YD repeat-containing protein
VDRNGREARFEYDTVGRMAKESWYVSALATVPADVILYGYDLANNLTSLIDGDSKVERSYDSRNLLSNEKQYGSDNTPWMMLSYSYDPNGNVLSVTDQLGTAVSSTYTSRNQLASRAWTIVGGGSLGTTFNYDSAGRVIELARTSRGAFSGKTQRTYDNVGNLSRLTHSGAAGQLFADTRYSHDGTVRLIGEQRLDQNVSYGYDADWQLTGANYTGQADENRAYDALGNLAGTTVGPHNRLLADANFNYVYDDEENLTRKTDRASGEVTDYGFDQRNRLTNVERRSAGGVILSSMHLTA